MKTVAVVAALIVREGRILATERGYGSLAGGWEFPGGKVEPDETLEQAVVREIAEELGVKIAVDSHCATVDYDYADFRLHMDCFWCRIVEGEIELREHSDARWLAPGELGSVDWLPADIELVGRLDRKWVEVPGTSTHFGD